MITITITKKALSTINCTLYYAIMTNAFENTTSLFRRKHPSTFSGTRYKIYKNLERIHRNCETIPAEEFHGERVVSSCCYVTRRRRTSKDVGQGSDEVEHPKPAITLKLFIHPYLEGCEVETESILSFVPRIWKSRFCTNSKCILEIRILFSRRFEYIDRPLLVFKYRVL